MFLLNMENPNIKRRTPEQKARILNKLEKERVVVNNPELAAWKDVLKKEMYQLINMLSTDEKYSAQWVKNKFSDYGVRVIDFRRNETNSKIQLFPEKNKGILCRDDLGHTVTIEFETTENNTEGYFGIVFNQEVVNVNSFLERNNIDFRFTANLNF
jgi:hypothetical protein